MKSFKNKKINNINANNFLGRVTAFDKNAENYDMNSSTQYMQAQKVIKDSIPKICELIKTDNLNLLSILDVGCGNGLTTIDFYIQLRQELVKINTEIEIIVTGIDISENMIQHSIINRNMEGISPRNLIFLKENIQELTEEKKYDIIFSSSALHWCTPNVYQKLFNLLLPNRYIIVTQGGQGCYKELHDIVEKAIKECNLSDYYRDWNFPVFYPSKVEIINLLKEYNYDNILVDSQEYNEFDNKDLINSFENASFLIYLEKLPNNNLKNQLKEKYFELCNKIESKNVAVHRLNIIAKNLSK